MLRSLKDLRGYGIRASDGVIGKVDGSKVLVSPIAVGHAGWMGRSFP